MGSRMLTNHDMDSIPDPEAIDPNRIPADFDSDPIDGYLFLPLIGVLPWEAEISAAVEAGQVICPVCLERPRVSESRRGLAVCCECSRASTDGRVSYWGENAGKPLAGVWAIEYQHELEHELKQEQAHDDAARKALVVFYRAEFGGVIRAKRRTERQTA